MPAAELSMVEQAVLDAIVLVQGLRGGKPMLSEVAREAAYDPAMVQQAVRSMVRKGFIRALPSGNAIEVVNLPVPGQISFSARGTPRPQGSKVAFVDDRGDARMLESSGENLKHWRQIVYWEAFKHRPRRGPIEGAVAVDITFFLPEPKRPKSMLPITRPDVDKLVRAVLDSLTQAGVIYDDNRVVDLSARKRYGPEPRADIRVRELAVEEVVS